nr:RHS repeat protein [Phycisphaerae bacterium]NIR62984.1 RHS repeat protein [candidate division Zixibacteria bacterium]NIW43860.1 hypothetical protein [Gammaproteobacteria bacterium]NIS45007.1 RHS repeat protein [candidate division Zixibacteria bacterium]NIU13105.1 RHS repeat protein [candidate division Zixibacteria bacterium]
GAVDLELTYGTGENLNPATKPDEKFEYFDGKTRKTKYDYSDDKNDYWQLEKQYVYEKDGVTETLCARTDLEYNLDYPILVHKKTTYQDLSDLDNSKVETIYVYGDKDGVPSEYGNSGKYLVRQKVLTDQSEDPDEYVETTYKYYEPLNMGGSTQHGGPVLIGRFGSGFGLIKEKIDPEGNRTLYKYDDYGYKTFEKIGPDGSEDPVKRFYHNVIGQLELEADYSGRVTRNYYDDFGRIGIVEVYEDPRAMKLPDNAFVPSTYVDTNTDIKLLSRIRYGYDAVGNRTFQQQEVLAGSPGAEPVLTTRDSIALEYNSGNLLKKVTYESSGDFDDSFVEYSYDSRGNKGTELIHDGITDREWWTLFWYDDMERQFYETSLDYDFSVKRAKVNHYYDTGQKKFEDLHGEHAIIEKLIDYEYDILGRMTKLTVDKGGEGYLNLVTQYSYDDAGNLDHIIDPCENYIYFDYDNANRNTTEYFATDSVTQPTRKKQINYNGNNDITAVTSYDYDGTTALAHKTFDYDNRRRLEKVEEFLEDPEGENPDKAVTTFDYEDPDEAGEEYKITINHPVGTEKTEILSNVLGKVSKVTYPSGKFQDMQYNGDGSLMRKRVFNPVGYDWIDFTYDNYGRLKEVTYPDLPTPGKVTYEYDGFGRRTKVTDNRITDDNIGGSSQIKYDYDVLGRVVKVTDQYDYELYYTYRADGQKEDIAVYKPGQQDPIYWVVYDYDYALRLNAVYEPRLGTDDLIAQLEYDNNGNRDKISYSKDGTAESTVDIDYTYNPDNFLTSFSTTGGRTFTFNATGTSPPDIDGLGRLVDAQEVLTKTDNTTVTYNLDYTYDMRSQLTEADITKDGSPWWDADYTYYKNGNLKDRTTDIPKTEFDYTGEIMNGTKAEGGESFTLTWDKHGNIDTTTLNNGLNFTYNWDDKLRKVEEQDETFVMSVRYDPDGNRIFKKNISEERKYIVDIAGDLPVILMELNNSGGIVKTYIYANSQIIAQHTGDHTANRYFYLHDRLGSVRQVIDTSGN